MKIKYNLFSKQILMSSALVLSVFKTGRCMYEVLTEYTTCDTPSTEVELKQVN
jgi:hypothetical protein